MQNKEITLNEVLSKVPNFLKGKQRTEFMWGLLFVINLPDLDFVITSDKRFNICHINLKFGIKADLKKFDLVDEWLENVKEASKKVASGVYCYLFNVLGYRQMDVDVFVDCKLQAKEVYLKVTAFLKSLEDLRNQVVARMIASVEVSHGKDIGGILKDYISFHIKGKNITRIFPGDKPKWLRNLSFRPISQEESGPWPSDLKVVTPKLELRPFYYFYPPLRDALNKVEEWKKLKQKLIEEGLIDEFCTPQVPVRKILREIEALTTRRRSCPFCERAFTKVRKDQATCGKAACRQKKSRLRKRIIKLIEENPQLSSEEISSIVGYERNVVEKILREIGR